MLFFLINLKLSGLKGLLSVSWFLKGLLQTASMKMLESLINVLTLVLILCGFFMMKEIFKNSC